MSIENELDYVHFLDITYEEPEIPISIYLDHIGDVLNDWIDSNNNEIGSIIQGKDKEVGENRELGEDRELA